MNFSLKKRLILVFFIILIFYSFNVCADSTIAYWTRAYCLYNAGSGGYACDSGQVSGDSASCNAANGAQCAEEGDVYCYSQSSCEIGSTTKGPVTAYNVNWDGDSADCSCKVGSSRWGIGGEVAATTCCGDDSGEYYITQGIGTEACCDNANDCVDGSNICRDNVIENTVALCSDDIDNDCDGLTDCQDSDCNGNIRGYVKDQDNVALDSAKVEAFQGSTWKAEAYTQPDGSYEINNINCGTYNLIASKTDYISDSKTNINLPPTTTLNNVDFTLTYGIVCEDDCSYLLDDRCHKECDGVDYKGEYCNFHDITARDKCDLAKIGWEVKYSATEFVECCEGSPKEIAEIKAFPSCPYKNLIKFHRIVYSKGKPIRLVTVVCGD